MYDNLLISIEDAQIPVSFYNINENNNTINFVVRMYSPLIMGDPDFFQLTIPVGNYDAYSLSLSVAKLFNDQFPYLKMTIMYEIGTNKFSFKLQHFNIYPGFPSIIGMKLTITFDNYQCSTVWGFDPSGMEIVTIENTLTIESTYSIDMAGSRFVFVQCPTFGTVNVNSKTGSVNQIISKIPIAEDYLSIQQYKNRGYANKIHNNKAITVIEINLLDENLNDINFNGCDWAITLTVVILGMPPEQLTVSNDEGNLSIPQNNNIAQ